MPDRAPFALSGLRSCWKRDDEPITTCSIVTTEANELMVTIHNCKKRMPLIVAKRDWGTWLNENASRQAVEHIMQPYPEGHLRAHEL